MEARRILILCEPGLLAQGLRSLLEADSRFQVFQVVGDARSTSELVREWKPHALLIEEDRFSLKLGEQPEPLTIDNLPTVVLLRRNDNTIHVYRVERHVPTTLQDLYETLTT